MVCSCMLLKNSRVMFRKMCSTQLVRMSSSFKVKLVPHIDKKVIDFINEGKMTVKKHPGRYTVGTVSLPEQLVRAVNIVMKDRQKRQIWEDSEALVRFMWGRHPPATNEQISAKGEEIHSELQSKMNKDVSTMTDDEAYAYEKRLDKTTKLLLRRQIHKWSGVDYTDYVGCQYLLRRMAGEYAALTKIFTEIVSKVKAFMPTTLFDFGSGVGTVYWASKAFWNDTLQEFFFVDASSDMNDLSMTLMKGGNTDKTPITGVFFRQFLPLQAETKYDIVICSYSLMELPSTESRFETLMALWNKTAEFLVIVEMGNNAGFSVVAEARDFILHYESKLPRSAGVYVFSPCPHEYTCPRYVPDSRPCTFQVPYLTIPVGRKSSIAKERFSYVVLRRGKRPESDPAWPRIISPVLVRHKHCIDRVCTREGKLQEVIFSKGKQGTTVYQVGRSVRWGDQLPVDIKEHVIDMSEISGSAEEEDSVRDVEKESDDEYEEENNEHDK